MRKAEEKKKKDAHLIVEALEKFTTLITSGLGLVAALAWNDTIQAFFKVVIPGDKNELWAKLLYSIVITAIVIVVVYELSKLTGQLKENLRKARKKE